MMISPVEMPLSAVIHEACRTPLDEDIVQLFCWDLLQALVACKNCGVHFKWLDTAHGTPPATQKGSFHEIWLLTLTFVPLPMSCSCGPVYVSADGYLKLGSLSAAYLESAVEDVADSGAATRPSKIPNLHTCSPEILMGDTVTASSSVWVAGCVATMLMMGKPPFKAEAEEKQIEYIFRACGTPRACDREYAKHARSLPYYQKLWGPGNEEKNYKPRLAKYLTGLKQMTPDRVAFLEGTVVLDLCWNELDC
jgi:serine/threonine protein kinase